MKLEEYGSVTISPPMLIRADDERFNFNLNRGAESYFNDAKKEVQGGAATLDQAVHALSLGISVQADPTQMAAYGEALQQYLQDKARSAEIRDLKDSAAREEYLSAIQSAIQEKDPKKRSELIATAKRNYANALQPPSSEKLEYPTAHSDTESTLAEPADKAKIPEDARKILSGSQLQGFRALLQGISPTINNRSALITAAGDNSVEAIFNILGNPAQGRDFLDKVSFLGAAMVSVEPGWRTQQDFAADISVHVEIRYRAARKLILDYLIQDESIPQDLREMIASNYRLNDTNVEIPEDVYDKKIPEWLKAPKLMQEVIDHWGLDTAVRITIPTSPAPAVAAVSPMTDVQVLDYTSSYRRRNEFALALSFALRSTGLGAQAQLFEQFVKQRENDVLTRTPEVPISSYSSGHIFGYQIGPVLKAVGDPSSKSPKPEYRLDRQSFPVLIVCGLDSENFQPLITASYDQANNFKRLIVLEPQIQFTQTHRWIPLTEKSAKNRLTETDVLTWNRNLELISNSLKPIQSKIASNTPLTDEEKAYMREMVTWSISRYRASTIRNLAIGSYSFQSLPVDLIRPRNTSVP
jgi:hypothetical protein